VRWLVALGKVDRRWIFLAIAVAVVVPLVARAVFPVVATPIVQNIFDKVESLPPGSRILLSVDYGPSTVPENQPMMFSVARHCLERGHKLYFATLWATGLPMLERLHEEVLLGDFPDRVEGVDWVNLGYKAGNQGVINTAFSDFKIAFPTDVNGADVREIPMMQEVGRLSDFHLIVGIGSGFPGVKEWIQFGGDPAGVPVAGGVTAVEAPLLYPYYPKQLLGLMGGLQGAAEYEAALVAAYPEFKATSEEAIQRMGPQTVAHLVIVFFIILGNVGYFVSRRAAGGGRRP
jgi:hypothetical protein